MMIQMMKISFQSEACIESTKTHLKIQMAEAHPASYSATVRICLRIYSWVMLMLLVQEPHFEKHWVTQSPGEFLCQI